MDESIFRKKSTEQITSPEQLDTYLQVTRPRIWVVIVVVAALIVGGIIWSRFVVVDSYISGTAKAEKGVLTIAFDNSEIADNVKEGMKVEIGETMSEVSDVGVDSAGNVIAVSNANVPDGSYRVRVTFKQTDLIKMLIN
ncbi:MAG TPA: hypothetical protein DCP06_02945 [Lachnospiraceae bacterium]|nr:hypothetical protein [Eubacterium sp.]HAK57914.1 hypothetical protein [Lachnospiraceae bacterium]